MALVALACGSPPPAQVVEDDSLTGMSFSDAPREASPEAIAPEDPRLAVAQRELAALLGHPLELELDAAAAKSIGNRLQDASLAALEDAATALARCRASKPDAFAFGARRLERIHVQYDPVSSGQPENPLLAGGTLSTRVHPGDRRLFDGSRLCQRFADALAADRTSRFATADPAAVPPDQHADYLAFLRTGSNEESEIDRLRRMALLAQLQPLLVQPELREAANEVLSWHGSTLSDLLRQPSSDAELVAATASSRAAWIAWVNQSGPGLGGSDLERVVRALFLEGDGPPALREDFDAAAFALPIIDQFVEKAGVDPDAWHQNPLWRFVVCPARLPSRGYPELKVYKYCNGAAFADVDTVAGRRRLADLLTEKRSDVLTRSALLHALRARGAEPVSALVEALGADRHVQHVALRALGDYSGWVSSSTAEHPAPLEPKALVKRIPTWWKTMPEQRSALLYLLVNTSASNVAGLPWHRLPELLGARIDARALTAYLREDPRTIYALPKLMPALSPGWSRAQVIVPAFERWLDAHAEGRIVDGHVYSVAENVRAALCAAGVPGDVEAMQRSLRKRAKRLPNEARLLPPYLTGSPEACCSPERSRSRAPAERVTFGD